MPTPTTIALFAVAALALLLIPGPVVIYTVARSVHQGRAAGLVSVLAAGLGDFGHVLAATLGLSALLLSSAVAFTIVKYAGAAYLIYIGVRTLLARDEQHQAQAIQSSGLARVFSQGLLVSLLNPKTALFFLAFLPQFVDPTKGAVASQILIFGSLFVAMGICTNGVYAFAAGAARGWLKGNARFMRSQRYITGGIYIALGVTTALAGTDKGK